MEDLLKALSEHLEYKMQERYAMAADAIEKMGKAMIPGNEDIGEGLVQGILDELHRRGRVAHFENRTFILEPRS